MSTTTDEDSTTSTAPQHFTTLSRILHWLTAILVISALFIGFVMVNSLSRFATLLPIHETFGAVVLLVVVVRVVNRLTHRPPALPPTIGRLERLTIAGSELALYALLLAQPLVGWAMSSAVGNPVTVFGSLHLPAIAPVNLALFGALRDVHSVLAYLLVFIVTAHIAAVLVHAIALGDGMLRRMTFRLHKRQPTGNP